MAMPAIRRHWTRADLARLPDDGNRYEVVEGELFVTPAPSPRHEELIRVLAERLGELTKGSGVTVYAGNSAVVLNESQLLPDVQLRARVIPPPEDWNDIPKPVLVVEVVSPVTRRRDLVAKRTLYADAGVTTGWSTATIAVSPFSEPMANAGSPMRSTGDLLAQQNHRR